MRFGIPEVEIALLAFTDDKGRIMLNRRADADSEMWELIGGGVEEGEAPEDAVRRETEEEIGYQLTDPDALKMAKEFTYENHKFSAKVYCFTAIYPGKAHFSDSEETFVDDLGLFTIEAAYKLNLLPMTRMFLEGDR